MNTTAQNIEYICKFDEAELMEARMKKAMNSHEMFNIAKGCGLSQDDLTALQRAYLEYIWGDVK